MTPNEGNQNVQGGGSATPNPSGTPDQPLSGDLATALAELKALKGEVSALKSGKDKAVNRMEQAVNPLIEAARYLGVDDEKIKEAQRNMALDELVAQKFGTQSAPLPGTVAVQTPTIEVTKLAAQYQLDENDASFIVGLSKTDPATWELEIAKRALAKQKQPSPTPAQNTAPAGGYTPQPENVKALTQDYIKKLGELRGKKDAIKALKAEYQAKGVAVDNISFSV
jgi:hypothetical protein